MTATLNLSKLTRRELARIIGRRYRWRPEYVQARGDMRNRKEPLVEVLVIAVPDKYCDEITERAKGTGQ